MNTETLTPTRQGDTNPVFVIAQNVKEARDIAGAGFGFSSRSDAEKALAEGKSEIDPYYFDLLNVFKVTNWTGTRNARKASRE